MSGLRASIPARKAAPYLFIGSPRSVTPKHSVSGAPVVHDNRFVHEVARNVAKNRCNGLLFV